MGLDGLILATFLSGFMLMAVGPPRLGTFVKYIPYPVTVGFTAGIAVIITASQIKDLLGLTLGEAEPGPIPPKLGVLPPALPGANPAAIGLAALAIALIALVRRYRPSWPGLLIGIGVASVVSVAFALPVETIGTRFGGIPNMPPPPTLPALSLDRVLAVLPAALSFALLGSIESLLSAVVADGMSGRRHRSNCELVGQGIANIGSALFGGFCVTGTIARTATNVRAGSRGPVSGMLHAVFVLVFMLLAAPLAAHIPLAALAGLLGVVAWNMAEKHAFARLLGAGLGDAVVLLTTLLLVVFRGPSEGILVGFGLGVLLFVHRMAHAVEVENATLEPQTRDIGDATRVGGRLPYDPGLATDRDLVVYRISGAFFFGAAASVGLALEGLGSHPRAYVVDLVPRIVKPRNMASCAFDGRHFWSRRMDAHHRCNRR
jgi:SulP family sulfate permease